jgi:hypothetical protein
VLVRAVTAGRAWREVRRVLVVEDQERYAAGLRDGMEAGITKG